MQNMLVGVTVMPPATVPAVAPAAPPLLPTQSTVLADVRPTVSAVPVAGVTVIVCAAPVRVTLAGSSTKAVCRLTTIWCRSDLALVEYAFFFWLKKTGIAIAAKIPMMIMTTRSSMRVKPSSLFSIALRIRASIGVPFEDQNGRHWVLGGLDDR